VDLIHPHTKRDAADALRAAGAAGTRVMVVGGRQHIDKGEPTDVDVELWTTLLDERVAYDPAEMLCVVEAGMRIRDLAALLGEGGQEWPVDAPDEATVGGVIATGGPTIRQLRVGMLRDTVVEMEVVTGDGRLVRSGARTVKNVTGFDVHRLMTGSLGTLGVIVQVALKVRPLPKAKRTLVTREGGIELATRLLRGVPLATAVLAEPDRIVLRLEGWREEVEEQTAGARSVAAVVEVEEQFPEPLFAGARIVAEAAVAPSRLEALLEEREAYQALVGIGFAWVPFDDEAALGAFRARAAELGGIAPVIRGPGGLGDGALPAAQVQRRVKDAMDPAGILAPGRMGPM
jgi:glycolate dehydrogenase FAD-binding subunit